MKHVVLLRGVNVGGHRTFRPVKLAEDLQHLGAINIGAAGTFVTTKPITPSQLRAELARRLPFETEIMICPGRDFAKLLAKDWFSGRPSRPDIVRFVSVLSRVPPSSPRLPVTLPDRGQWMLRVLARQGRFVIGEYRRQMKAIGYLGTLDRVFGAPATTRNWNTMTAIGKALDNATSTLAGGRGETT
jgi:uncharacterized protein (DUF1697 family)